MSGSDVFNSFYARLRDVQKYHARFAQAKDSVRGNVCDTVKPEVVFSGEEALGRWVLAWRGVASCSMVWCARSRTTLHALAGMEGGKEGVWGGWGGGLA
jgi:hypothetical protein